MLQRGDKNFKTELREIDCLAIKGRLSVEEETSRLEV